MIEPKVKVNGHEVLEFKTHFRKITDSGYYDFKNKGYIIKNNSTATVTIDDVYEMSRFEVIGPGLSMSNAFIVDRLKIVFGSTGTKDLQIAEILPHDPELAHYVNQKIAR